MSTDQHDTQTQQPEETVPLPDLGDTERDRAYRRALDAEPQLQPAVRVVDALCALVRADDYLCHACVWESIVKPLVDPWVGWDRGYLPQQASDAPRDTWEPINLTDYLKHTRDDRKLPADTDTERWLRTSEAFDAFTGVLIDRLYAADPGNGHGIGRQHMPAESTESTK